jgi:hypothetical protein
MDRLKNALLFTVIYCFSTLFALPWRCARFLASVVGCLYKKLTRLVKRCPLVGEVSRKIIGTPAVIPTPQFGGRKSTRYPTILEIEVSGSSRRMGGIGKLVHATYFKKYPRLLFNVCYSCGKPGLLRGGVYGDPLSIWFNVFFGYWEVDVLASALGRPFGYGRLVKCRRAVKADEVLRVVKADWNYFSNHVYGTPASSISGAARDLGKVGSQVFPASKRVAIAGRQWDRVVLRDVEVVTTYQPGDGPPLAFHSCYTPLWRFFFGRPSPRPDFNALPAGRGAAPLCFPTKMFGELYMCYTLEHDEDLGGLAYKTFFFGGSAHQNYPEFLAGGDPARKKALEGENRAFLDAQLSAARKVIEDRYPRLGFTE